MHVGRRRRASRRALSPALSSHGRRRPGTSGCATVVEDSNSSARCGRAAPAASARRARRSSTSADLGPRAYVPCSRSWPFSQNSSLVLVRLRRSAPSSAPCRSGSTTSTLPAGARRRTRSRCDLWPSSSTTSSSRCPSQRFHRLDHLAVLRVRGLLPSARPSTYFSSRSTCPFGHHVVHAPVWLPAR